MNCKCFAICIIVGFAFVFGYEYVVHHILLGPTYETTPQLWRPMETMEQFMPIMLGVQILTVSILCYLYTLGHEGKGIGEGIRFGLVVGLLLGVMQGSAYVWMPISQMLALSWFAAVLVKTIGLGIIFSLIYKK